jgi:hypothetical protein
MMMKRLTPLLFLAMLPMAHATVTNQNVSVSFTCSGTTGPFPFTFPISSAGSITVVQNQVILAPGTYSVTPVNNNFSNGGNVTLNVSCPVGQPLVVTRMTPMTQTTIYTENMPLPMKSFEMSLDKLTEITQELFNYVNVISLKGKAAGANTQVQYNNGGVFGADSGMTYNNATHILNTGINDRGGEVYNVMAFGAVGDGSTDDGPVLQSILTMMQSTGKCMYLPASPVKYKVLEPLIFTQTSQFTPSACIYGDGMTTSLIDFEPTSPVGSGAAWGSASISGGQVLPGLPTNQGSNYHQNTLITVTGIHCASTSLPVFTPVFDNSGHITGLSSLGGLNVASGSGCSGTPVITATDYIPAIQLYSQVTNTTQYGIWLHDFGITSTTPNQSLVGVSLLGQRDGHIDRVSIQNMGDAIQVPIFAGGADNYENFGIVIDGSYLLHNKGWGFAGYGGWATGNVTITNTWVEFNSKGGIYAATNYLNITGNSIAFNGCNTTATPGNGSPGSVVCDFNAFGNGGGIYLDRLSSTGNGYQTIIEQNELESNYLYHIWVAGNTGTYIQSNKDNTWTTIWNDGWPHPGVHFILGGWNFPNTTGMGQTRMTGNLHRMQNVAAGSAYDTNTILYSLLDNNASYATVVNPFFGSLVNNLTNFASTAGVNAYVTVSGGIAGTVQIGWGGAGNTNANIGSGASSPMTFALPSTVSCSVQPVFGTATVNSDGTIATIPTSSGGSGCTNGTYALVPTPPALTINESINRHLYAKINNETVYQGDQELVGTVGLGFMGNTPGTADAFMKRGALDRIDTFGGDPSAPDTVSVQRWVEDTTHYAEIRADSASSVIRFQTAGKIPYFGSTDANAGNLIYNNAAVVSWTGTDIHPSVASAMALGSTAFPWSDLYIGQAPTNVAHFDTSALNATRTITIPNANSNTVQPLGSATVGQFVQYIDSSGVQHLGPSVPSTIFAITAPVTNTGSTGETQIINTAKVPAGTMTTTGKISVEMHIAACTAANTPFASCAGANTGTCTARAYLGTTNSSLTSQLFSGFAITAAKGGYFKGNVRNQNSASAQQVDGIVISGSASQSPFSPPSLHTTFNTGNDLYVNVTMTNSQSADYCGVDQIDITNWP